jgi:hypothetical protein
LGNLRELGSKDSKHYDLVRGGNAEEYKIVEYVRTGEGIKFLDKYVGGVQELLAISNELAGNTQEGIKYRIRFTLSTDFEIWYVVGNGIDFATNKEVDSNWWGSYLQAFLCKKLIMEQYPNIEFNIEAFNPMVIDNIDFSQCPIDGVKNYYLYGHGGGFMSELMQGDLYKAISKADIGNKELILKAGEWILFNMPSHSYGSKELVSQWKGEYNRFPTITLTWEEMKGG